MMAFEHTTAAGTRLVVYGLAPQRIAETWHTLAPYISRGLAYGYDAYPLDECRRLAQEGELLVVVVEEVVSHNILVVLTLELSTVQGLGDICHIVTAGGSEMEDWLDWLQPIVQQVGREQGAALLTTKGRKGWERALAPKGWTHRYTIMSLPTKEPPMV